MKFHKRLQRKIEHKDNNWLPYTIATCSAVVLFLLLSNLPELYHAIGSFISLLKPVLTGIAIAYLMNPLVKIFNKGLSKIIKNETLCNGLSIIITSVLILLLTTLLLSFLIPQLIDSIMQFVSHFSAYSEAVRNLINELAATMEAHNFDMEIITEMFNKVVDKIITFFSANGEKLVNKSFSLGSGTANLFIGIILALYFLASKKSILSGFDKLLINIAKPEKYISTKNFLDRCNKIFTAFIVQDLIDSCIVGVVNFVFMSLMDMSYTVLISMVVGITNLAPTFGPFVGAFIGGFILLFADPGSTVAFLIFTLILQLIDGYVIKPKLFGGTMGVAGVWITVGIIIGGKLFGVLGILFAVPLLGIMTFVYKDFIDSREAERLELIAQARAKEEADYNFVREEPDFPDDH